MRTTRTSYFSDRPTIAVAAHSLSKQRHSCMRQCGSKANQGMHARRYVAMLHAARLRPTDPGVIQNLNAIGEGCPACCAH